MIRQQADHPALGSKLTYGRRCWVMSHLESLPPPEERTEADWQRFYVRRYIAAIRASFASEEHGDLPDESTRIMVEVLNWEDDSGPEALQGSRGLAGNR